jgi:hypothetical protein
MDVSRAPVGGVLTLLGAVIAVVAAIGGIFFFSATTCRDVEHNTSRIVTLEQAQQENSRNFKAVESHLAGMDATLNGMSKSLTRIENAVFKIQSLENGR